MAIFTKLGKFTDTGILLTRLGVGIMFMMHGFPKLMGGPEKWEKTGAAIFHLGISVFPTAWGLAASVAEVLGGLLFAVGLFFRPSSLALAFTMVVAAAYHLGKGDGIMGSSHAIEMGLVFLGFAFIGPGKYSLDKR